MGSWGQLELGENLETGNRVLAVLLEEGLITSGQAKRIEKQLDKGVNLHEALHKTPLVEPVKLSSIMGRIRVEDESREEVEKPELPTEPPAPPPRTPAPPPMEEQPTGNIRDFTPIVGDVIDAALELDDSDLMPLDLDDGDKFVIEDLGPVSGDDIEEHDPSGEGVPVVELELDLDSPVSGRETPQEVELPEDLTSSGLDDELDLDDPSTAAHVIDESYKDLDIDEDLILPDDPSTKVSVVTNGLDDDFDFDGLDDDLDLSFDAPQPLASPPSNVADEDVDSALEDVFGSLGDDEDKLAGPGIDTSSMEDLRGMKVRPIRDSASSDAVPMTLKLPDDPEAYDRGKIVTFNLYDDEGINLIHEVNQRLLRVIEISGQGMVLDRARDENNFRVYNSKWALEEMRTLSEPEIDKMINRIRVMARLEAWKRNELQKGQCLVTAGSNCFRLLVESVPIKPGRETLTLYYMAE